MREPVLWASVHGGRRNGICKVQALVRGWLVRKRLAMAGPGVLCRKNLANDEEIITGETKIHPMDYFAFEEAGKVWWFSFESLWKWAIRTPVPANPYTRVPLTVDTRKRLREMWAYWQRHRLRLPEESQIYGERVRARWNLLTQVFHDNGFVDVGPETFLRLGMGDYATMFVLLHRDLLVVLNEKDPQRDKILRYCRRGMTAAASLQPRQYVLHSVYTIMVLLSCHKNPYSMVFSVLSALFRC